MTRLLSTLVAVLGLLALLDRVVASLGSSAADMAAIDFERREQFRLAIAEQFEELRVGVGRLTAATHARWEAVPTEKSPRELRIVLIGNSSGMFALVPSLLQARLATAWPNRDVRVIPLFLPGVRLLDEEILLRAALAKHADVVVLTPNLKDLIAAPSDLGGSVRKLFAPARGREAGPTVSDAVDQFLQRHWKLYRDRELLRMRILGAAARLLAPGTEVKSAGHDPDAAFSAIASAAARGNVGALLEAYRDANLGAFVRGEVYRERLHPRSTVFDLLARMATTVRQANAVGVAVFMPVHPLFRNAAATDGFPEVSVDDAYVRALAARVLGIFQAAGFRTVNQLDALPASAFIDLIHVNAEGMERFTRETADALVAAFGADGPTGTPTTDGR